MNVPDYGVAIISIVLFLLGGGLGFFITRKLLQKQVRENPPIDESTIRAMYAQMGRKPTETQIRQIMSKVKSDPKKK